MGKAVKGDVHTGKHFNRTPTHKPRSPIDKAKGYEIVWNQVSPLFDAARACITPSFVYLIGEADNGPLKIGVSKDPIARLRTMQTGNPRRLRIEYVLLGGMAIEKLLHELWEPFAVLSARSTGKPDAAPGTEWFKPEARDQLLPIIEEAARRQGQYLDDAVDGYDYADLERLIRDAHADSDFVAQGRDEVRLLARGAGYAIGRPSRI